MSDSKNPKAQLKFYQHNKLKVKGMAHSYEKVFVMGLIISPTGELYTVSPDEFSQGWTEIITNKELVNDFKRRVGAVYGSLSKIDDGFNLF